MRIIISQNFNWQFNTFNEEQINSKELTGFKTVNLPHHAVEIPFNHFDEKMLHGVFSYVKDIMIEEKDQDKLIRLRFEGVAHLAKVYVNGRFACEHIGGYTPFEVVLNDYILFGQENRIFVVVDSRELDFIPPFGGVVDYLGYSGIYREVELIITEKSYIENIFVYTNESHRIFAEVKVSEQKGLLIYKVKNHKNEVSAQGMIVVDNSLMKIETEVNQPMLWDLEHPYLYQLEISYEIDQKMVDFESTRFGIRTAVFINDGFYLNGNKIKLLGLNRHQSFPYVGYAMPKSAQIEDADQLKYDLGIQIVRTSHYPQSIHFLNRCDEIGLLVFEEIPGWQHIGHKKWQDISVKNVEEMVIRDRNHPSIIMWGVRINEAPDAHDFYTRTNETSRRLDPTRQTGGVRNFQFSEFLEDVYTYNDFSHTGQNDGLDQKKKITKDVPYLVTEHNGHMFPTKRFDHESKRLEHALRHLRVIDDMMNPDNGISGSIGWCMFDYNTHKEFGSGDKICYHGVYDMFRLPKLASASYRSQQDKYPVLEVSSNMNYGEHPGGYLPKIAVFTNLDYVKLYKNDEYIDTFFPDQKTYPHLKHAPIFIDDFIGETLMVHEHMSRKDAEATKKIFKAITTTGNRLPLRQKLKMLYLLKKYKMKVEDGFRMFYTYSVGWGSKKVTYRFEGYQNDQLIKTVIKEDNEAFSYEINLNKEKLVIDQTYDVLKVHVKKVNQQQELTHYAFDPFHVECSGAIELIGPSQLNLHSGELAFWVRSLKKGKGKVKISFNDQTIEREVLVVES